MAKGGGGSSSNPIEAYNRQKRKKQVQKNKQERIKARDEKVVETKTVAQVEDEIRNIKKRGKNLQFSEQQKLQRLEKELKLVQAAKDSQPKPSLLQQQQQQLLEQQAQRPLTELDDPRKSVYYDERLNPYGAPPPGKPRLYHQRGGGVTMDIRWATVPGEEPPPPPPPPRSAPPPPPRSREPPTNQRHQHQHPNNRDRSGPSSYKKSPEPINQNNSNSNKTSNPATTAAKKDETTTTTTTTTTATKDKNDETGNKPLEAPALPAPSKAVQRSRRGKASVDIWASNEEVDYERRANQIDLEADDVGAAAPAAAKQQKKKKQMKKKLPLEISYRDQSGQVQGPFPKAQIQGWFAAGFFPPTTMVKTNRKETWLPIAELQALQPEPATTVKEDEPDHDPVQDRIAALKKQENSVEERIAALKEKKESTVEDRIAALKRQDEVSDDPDDQAATVQKRIAALRAAQAQDETDAAAPPPPPPPVPSNGSELQDESPAYPMDDDDDDDVPGYPVGHDDKMGPPPPPYPVDDDDDDDDDVNDNTPGVAPYPSVDEEPPAYPFDDDYEEAAYPVDNTDEHNDDTYPINDTYPLPEDEEAGAAYPVTDSYPVIDEYPATGDYDTIPSHPADIAPVYPMPPPPPAENPKKVVKVDKEVIAFLPSHLQNRKRKSATQQQASGKPKKAKAAPSTKATNDDYDKLMEEIEDF